MSAERSGRRWRLVVVMRGIAAALVLLVMTSAPLHRHADASSPASSCLVCEISHRPLDLPPAAPAGAAAEIVRVHVVAEVGLERPRARELRRRLPVRAPPPSS